jgi:hypothetical protein
MPDHGDAVRRGARFLREGLLGRQATDDTIEDAMVSIPIEQVLESGGAARAQHSNPQRREPVPSAAGLAFSVEM